MDIRIRPFSDEDEAFALRLVAAEGWDTTAATIRALRRHDPEGWFVGEADGRRAGIVSTTRCPGCAWIGHVIVVPDFRRRGLGTLLTRRAIQCLEDAGSRTIRLEADPPAVAIYRRLGWETEYESARLRRPAMARRVLPGPPSSSAVVTRWRPADGLPAEALAADRAAVGFDRTALLRVWGGIAQDGWLVDGGLRGYAMIIPAAGGARIGPWVATDARAAEAMLRRAIAGHGDAALLVGVPATNADALALLPRFEFAREEPSERMVRGRRVADGEQSRLYGIASGATG